MIVTFKPIVINRRKDGTWPVKIRVTFKGVSRRLPTTLSATSADLTRGGWTRRSATRSPPSS